MSILETIRVALQSIRANLLRSILTMLGIIIGVAAVITMVAIGTGAQRAIDAQINDLGSNLVTVMAGQSFFHGVASANRVSLKQADADALLKDGLHFSGVVPELQAGRQLKYGGRNAFSSIIGTTPNYGDVNAVEIDKGRMFTQGDNEARRRYAVLGAGVPETLHDTAEYLLGKTITIGQIPFVIIGVFKQRGSSMGPGPSPDEDVYVPIDTARYRAIGTDRIRAINVQIAEGISLEEGMVDIEQILRREHGIRPGGENDFMIMNRRQILQTRQAATAVFTTLLASIAGVSLLVGGIGIMNIMLVSVTERTREIGVRKALGATRANILLQFLIEALTLGAIGGVVGIAIGVGAAFAIANAAGWKIYVSPQAVLTAVAFSVGVGLIFGMWPARRAAMMDPIDALRHD